MSPFKSSTSFGSLNLLASRSSMHSSALVFSFQDFPRQYLPTGGQSHLSQSEVRLGTSGLHAQGPFGEVTVCRYHDILLLRNFKILLQFPNPFGILRLLHITGVAALEHAPGIVSLTRRHRGVAFWGQFDATDATVTIIVS